MGFEPDDKRNVKTMGKETISNDIRGEKTENGYIRRTNEEIYESYQEPQRLNNKSKKVIVAGSHGGSYQRENG